MSKTGGLLTAAAAEKEREDGGPREVRSEGKGEKWMIKGHSGAFGVIRPSKMVTGAVPSTVLPGAKRSGAVLSGAERPKAHTAETTTGLVYFRRPGKVVYDAVVPCAVTSTVLSGAERSGAVTSGEVLHGAVTPAISTTADLLPPAMFYQACVSGLC